MYGSCGSVDVQPGSVDLPRIGGRSGGVGICIALLAVGLFGPLWGPGSAEAGGRLASCGGLNQRACYIWETFPSCDAEPFMYERIESCGFLCLQGYCRALSCGGRDERPCTIFEHIPACESGLIEEPLLVACRAIDGHGYPTVCGDGGESACSITAQIALGIRSCKPGNYEALGFPLGSCHALDGDGFPPYCGGTDEQACSIDLQIQLGIRSCKPQHYEQIGFPFGTCRPLDDDGYPFGCGGPDEPLCGPELVFIGVLPCKPGLLLDLGSGTCEIPPLDDEGYPIACGGDGEVACNILLQIVLGVRPCKGGLDVVPGFPDASCRLTSVNEPELGTDVTVEPSDPDAPIRGYADVHNHIFPNGGFGGAFYAGRAFHPYGVEAALDRLRGDGGFRAGEGQGAHGHRAPFDGDQRPREEDHRVA